MTYIFYLWTKQMNKYLKRILLVAGLCSMLNATDDGPRMYWNAPVGTNILQVYFWTANGNSISPENTQPQPGFDTDINKGILGYNRIIDVAGHSAIATAVITGGKVSGSLLDQSLRSSSGMEDLYLQGVINLFGAPALSAEAFGAYRQDTVLSLLVGVTAPTGDYENNRALNMGVNRWSARVALPFMFTLGDWIPGEITTLEILPSVWFYGDNDNSFGSNLEQDAMYTLEAHITRDITASTFVSLDYFVQRVGDSFTDGLLSGFAHTSDSLGVTLGYMFNARTQFQLRYASTLSPEALEGELEADMFQFNLNYFW
jgi:hypothetical protein